MFCVGCLQASALTIVIRIVFCVRTVQPQLEGASKPKKQSKPKPLTDAEKLAIVTGQRDKPLAPT